MKRISGVLFVCFVLAFCIAAPSVSGQDESAESPQEAIQKPKGYFAVKPLPPDVDLDQVMESVNAGTGLQMWSYNITSSRDHNNYSGVMVGKTPFSTASASSSITAQIVPLIIKMTGPNGTGTATFNPTVADTKCLSAPNDVPLALFQQSPIILNAKFTMNGISVGTTQYTDAFQRANFWSEVVSNHNNFHTLLSPKTLSPITVTVPAASGLAYTTGQFGGCANGLIGVMDINWFDSYVKNTLLPQLVSKGVNPTTFPMFFMYNVVMSDGAPNIFGACCILGYHGAKGGVPVQTYSPFEFDTTRVFTNTEDISIASHEVGEWMDDPLGNNPTPAWGHIGQVSGCQGNLEVGDPLSGTLFPAIKMSNGFTYHPQELAFFSWFYGAPSIGAGADFSDHETFEADAGAICH